jgi:hypothetical protein
LFETMKSLHIIGAGNRPVSRGSWELERGFLGMLAV